jgi:hypothetical protein
VLEYLVWDLLGMGIILEKNIVLMERNIVISCTSSEMVEDRVL